MIIRRLNPFFIKILAISNCGFFMLGLTTEVVKNGNFETGTLDGWKTAGDTAVVTPALDPVTNNSLQMVAEGNYSAKIGDEIPWNGVGNQQSSIEQEVVVPTDVSQNSVLQFVYAVVANDPPDHDIQDKPRFRVDIEDLTDIKVLSDTNYLYTSQSSGDWYLGVGNNSSIINSPYYALSSDRWVFRPWTEVQIPLAKLAGHHLIIRFEVRDCNLGAHAAYGYLDAVRIGEPVSQKMPAIENNPAPAAYVNPPFWAPALSWFETNGAIWLCFLVPALILLLFLVWLLSKLLHRPSEPPPIGPVKYTAGKKEDNSGSSYGADRKR
jgi:hypothetical protein